MHHVQDRCQRNEWVRPQVPLSLLHILLLPLEGPSSFWWMTSCTSIQVILRIRPRHRNLHTMLRGQVKQYKKQGITITLCKDICYYGTVRKESYETSKMTLAFNWSTVRMNICREWFDWGAILVFIGDPIEFWKVQTRQFGEVQRWKAIDLTAVFQRNYIKPTSAARMTRSCAKSQWENLLVLIFIACFNSFIMQIKIYHLNPPYIFL